MSGGYLVQLDPTPHARKPEGAEIAAITRRLQAGGPRFVTLDELTNAILKGGTLCGGCYAANRDGWGDFVSQQLFGLDFDNDGAYKKRETDPKTGRHVFGKRQLLPDEAGYITPGEALARCRELGLAPTLAYHTAKSKGDRWPRYRLLFDAGEPVTDEARACGIIAQLLAVFPEADQSCKNSNRLFFGAGELGIIDLETGM